MTCLICSKGQLEYVFCSHLREQLLLCARRLLQYLQWAPKVYMERAGSLHALSRKLCYTL